MVGMHNIICHWALYVEKLCGLERQIVAAEPQFNLELFWIYNNLSIRVTQCKRRTFPHIGKNSYVPLKIFPFSVQMKNLTEHIRPTWLWAVRGIVSLSLPVYSRWGSSRLFLPLQSVTLGSYRITQFPCQSVTPFYKLCNFCLLHHVGISLFQVDVQDRHHVVSLRRPAVRPQVWLLDLLWLAGWLWQRVPLILFKFIPFLRIYFHRIGCQTFCVSLIQDKKIQYQYPSFYFASKHGPAHGIYNPSSNSIGIQYNTLHNVLFV